MIFGQIRSSPLSIQVVKLADKHVCCCLDDTDVETPFSYPTSSFSLIRTKVKSLHSKLLKLAKMSSGNKGIRADFHLSYLKNRSSTQYFKSSQKLRNFDSEIMQNTFKLWWGYLRHPKFSFIKNHFRAFQLTVILKSLEIQPPECIKCQKLKELKRSETVKGPQNGREMH